jgi:hypothetical protein
LEQSILVARHQKVELERIKDWCERQGGNEAFAELEAALQNA